jgi:hypothetical protein
MLSIILNTIVVLGADHLTLGGALCFSPKPEFFFTQNKNLIFLHHILK